ncbi:MAG: deoxyribodipyrimidine photo-lyase, partial [Pseudohongiellaceae bacterium]
MTRRTPITTITSTAATSIVWFRQDLRLADNPALTAAAQVGSVLPVYILDDINSAEWAMGGASRWWLHHSLSALNESLGGRLVVLRGDPLLLLPELAKKTNAQAVFWNRCYEPWRIARDTRIKERLHADSITVHSHNG